MRPVRVADDAPLLSREPVMAASVPTVLAALLAVVAAFTGWSPSPDQLAALAGLWAVLTPLLAAWARSRVVPGTMVDETTEKWEELK
jgi:hypothetical protein